MRRVVTVCAAALAMAVLTFGQSGLARAATVTNTDIPINETDINPCNGDVVTVSGIAHMVLTTTTDGAGGLHIVGQINTQDVAGTSLTGAKYQVQENAAIDVNMPIGANEANTVVRLRFVSPGSQNNFVLSTVEHITVNADGTVTVLRSSTSTSCQ